MCGSPCRLPERSQSAGERRHGRRCRLSIGVFDIQVRAIRRYKELHMFSEQKTDRRSFLVRAAGVAAAAGLSVSGGATLAAAESGNDDWLNEVKGTHRCLFDFPQHKNGFPLLHILNYINTYQVAYKTQPGQVG